MTTLVFAIATAVLLYRLFMVLGRDEGGTDSKEKLTSSFKSNQTPDKLDLLLRRYKIPVFLKSVFSEILLRESKFDIGLFIKNATTAHELILKHALANTLSEVEHLLSATARDMLSRQLEHSKDPLVRTQLAEIINAEFRNPIASITLKFTTQIKMDRGDSNLEEDWVFLKDLSKDTPVWVLDAILKH